MKYKFFNLIDGLVNEFWSILLIDWNFLGWFDGLLEEADNVLFVNGYPPIFVRFLNEDGEYGDWVLSDYYQRLYISFDWKGKLVEFKTDMVIPLEDPNYNEYCQNLKVGYPMAGLFECNDPIEWEVDVLKMM